MAPGDISWEHWVLVLVEAEVVVPGLVLPSMGKAPEVAWPVVQEALADAVLLLLPPQPASRAIIATAIPGKKRFLHACRASMTDAISKTYAVHVKGRQARKTHRESIADPVLGRWCRSRLQDTA
jgi:hypothetical protein